MSFFGHHAAVGYPLERVEIGDEVLIGFAHGTQFKAIVIHEPSDFRLDVIDTMGVRMDVPSTLVLSHRERGVWHESRQAA